VKSSFPKTNSWADERDVRRRAATKDAAHPSVARSSGRGERRRDVDPLATGVARELHSSVVVPTQIVPAATGDSANVEMVQYGVLGKPIFVLSFVVRVRADDFPRVRRGRAIGRGTWAPAYSVLGSNGGSAIGAIQLYRSRPTAAAAAAECLCEYQFSDPSRRAG
jgi:hypothetical protein